MASGDKPWLAQWHVDHEGIGDRPRIVDGTGKYVMEGYPGAREQMALAAAGPEMVRALLAVEWLRMHRAICVRCSQCYECSACKNCKVCSGGSHGPCCHVDAALAAAGLPCQRSRDAAREAIAAQRKENAA